MSQEYYRNYYLKNREQILKNSYQYRLENAKKMNAKYRCQCGGKFTMKNITTHGRSKRHINYVYCKMKVTEENSIIYIPKEVVVTNDINTNPISLNI